MGIEGLIKFIEEFAPNAIGVNPLHTIRGTKIGIDGHGWMYTNMAIARKKVIESSPFDSLEINKTAVLNEWLKMALDFCISWLNNQITPIFIFDDNKTNALDSIEGEINLAKEKIETFEERREKRKDLLERIETKKKNLLKTDPLCRSTLEISEYRKLLSQLNVLSDIEISTLKDTLKRVGIPVIISNFDGERLGSMLVREGKIFAFFSSDSDNIAYGCPKLLFSFDKTHYGKSSELNKNSTSNSGIRIPQKAVRFFLYSELEKKLNEVGFTRDMFIDFCILCKCDYNSKISGIGPKTAFKLIKEFKNIESIGTCKGIDVSGLNYKVCRKIFNGIESSKIILGSAKFDCDENSIALGARGYLDQYNLGTFSEKFMMAYNNFTHNPAPKLILLTGIGNTGSSNSAGSSSIKILLPLNNEKKIISPSENKDVKSDFTATSSKINISLSGAMGNTFNLNISTPKSGDSALANDPINNLISFLSNTKISSEK